MKTLPELFLKVHQSVIVNSYCYSYAKVYPKVIRVHLIEPLGVIKKGISVNDEIQIISLECNMINSGQQLSVQAVTEDDQKAIEAWAEKHAKLGTTLEQFTWRPFI